MSADSNGAVGLVTHLAPGCGKVSRPCHSADRGPRSGGEPDLVSGIKETDTEDNVL
jgi:hypothetical protein